MTTAMPSLVQPAPPLVAPMIELIEYPDPDVEQQVRQYLDAAGEQSGVCGEHDPSWLAVLHDGQAGFAQT